MGHPDLQQELYERYWLNIENALAAKQSTRPIDLFLRDFMRWRTGEVYAIQRT